jgi:hypothetical protein
MLTGSVRNSEQEDQLTRPDAIRRPIDRRRRPPMGAAARQTSRMTSEERAQRRRRPRHQLDRPAPRFIEPIGNAAPLSWREPQRLFLVDPLEEFGHRRVEPARL